MRSPLPALSAAVILLAAGLTGCSSFDPGAVVAENRAVTDVRAVELDTSGDLTVTRGDVPSLKVIAGSRIIEQLTTDIDDGVLRLGMAGGTPVRTGAIRYELTVSALASLTVRGSGDASADFTGADDAAISVRGSGDVEAQGIDGRAATLTVDGSGEITVEDARVDSITVRLDGSGAVAISGDTQTQDVEISGDGDYEAGDLHSADAVVTIHGAGDALITASRTLDARIDGSGSISYDGDAQVTKEISGSGDLLRR
ncbi:GIN domain-containing protein [Microbacterium saperdae]|uniref:Putative autotransporter adhesin-like protein n=1 Tax=Microbacterium saperdae TaxID=69368 RepID=A0A543BMI9_9MICO|nr:DUF2807 domain-containing protein [Microbacterium saperdae]TQL86059.1 putative autotransporter adhesin-like protein [Microbacterium saperdae]GGM50916.1 hypothetical protein GCM10010489_23040 [Microbacterium saperdae]